MEHIAICYGYTKIIPVLPPSATIASKVRINKFTDFLRQEMAQAQFNEVLNFALCSNAEEPTLHYFHVLWVTDRNEVAFAIAVSTNILSQTTKLYSTASPERLVFTTLSIVCCQILALWTAAT